MQHYTSASSVKPPEWDVESSPTRVYHNTNITATETDDGTRYTYDVDDYSAAEYAAMERKKNRSTNEVAEIVFVKLAEAGDIDPVTAGEHVDVFAEWAQNVTYAVGQIRVDPLDGNLYSAIQAHTSQEGWNPSLTPALWKRIADPAEEWPEWSQPIGSADAYMKGAKTTHSEKRWVSSVDYNVWEPGVYGWEAAEA